MANTYTQLNIHAVFSVKGRENLLSAMVRKELFLYAAGILKDSKNYPLAVNGFRDHLHVFFELNPSNSVSDVMNKLKANSSKWVNERKFMPGVFNWQAGYAAFTYSRSQRNVVIQYIINQEQHHHKTTFKEEYLQILKEFGINHDMRYLFDFYS
jgi:REP element-mobilizing transposase RayT